MEEHMRPGLALRSAAFAALAAFAFPAHAGPLSFGEFVTTSSLSTTLSNNATIGFSYAGDKFVGSVYFGTNNNQLYSTDLTGGNVQKFGAPIAGFSGEIYVNASLGLGGFGPRDVFAGSEAAGTVVRVAHDGSSQGVFATGLVGGVRSIAFDPFGLYGNQMIVATNAGNIYRVSNLGVATLLASVGEDAEGLSFAPQAFGTFAAGTLFVASEGSGVLRAIKPDGTTTTAVTGLPSAEMVSFVPLNLGSSGSPVEGFYAANYASNIVKADASQFTSYLGDARHRRNRPPGVGRPLRHRHQHVRGLADRDVSVPTRRRHLRHGRPDHARHSRAGNLCADVRGVGPARLRRTPQKNALTAATSWHARQGLEPATPAF
jgi:hypothetical protein